MAKKITFEDEPVRPYRPIEEEMLRRSRLPENQPDAFETALARGRAGRHVLDEIDAQQAEERKRKQRDLYYYGAAHEKEKQAARAQPTVSEVARAQVDDANAQAASAIERQVNPGAAAGVGAMAYGRGQSNAALQALAMRGPTVTSPNPAHPVVMEYAGSMAQARAAELGMTQELMAAQRAEANELAGVYEQHAQQEKRELVAMQARERVRQQHLDEAMESQRMAMSAYSDAVGRLEEAPDIDPGRYWADQPAILGIMAMFGTGLLAAAGHPDPMANINKAIDRDIQAQKANLAKLQDVAGRRREGFTMASQVYGDILSKVKDERVADKLMRMARYEELATRLQAMQASSGATQMPYQQGLILAGLQRQHAQEKLQVEQMILANPATITRRMGLTPDQRWALQQQAKFGQDMAMEGFKEYAKAVAKGEEMQQVPPELRHIYGSLEEMREGLKNVRAVNTEQYRGRRAILAHVTRLREFLDKHRENIPGFIGLGATNIKHGLGDEANAFDALYNNVVDEIGRDRSGAALPDFEWTRYTNLVTGGNTEGQLYRRVQMLEDVLRDAVFQSEYGLREPERQMLHRNPYLAPLQPTMSSGGATFPGSFIPGG